MTKNTRKSQKKRKEWKTQAVNENWLEGIRLNLFGGSTRDVLQYLKMQNRTENK